MTRNIRPCVVGSAPLKPGVRVYLANMVGNPHPAKEKPKPKPKKTAGGKKRR